MAAQAFRPDISSALAGPEWLRRLRADAARRFDEAELPTTDLEEWRYSRIDDLDLDAFAPAALGDTASDLPTELAATVHSIGASAGRVVAVDGHIVSIELDRAVAALGVHFGRLADLDAAPIVAGAGVVVDPFDDLNLAFSSDPVALVVPRGVVVDLPFVVVSAVHAGGRASFPHLVVVARENSQCRVVELSGSADVAALVVPRTIVHVEQAARVALVSVQQLGAEVTQLGGLLATVGQSAQLDAVHSAMGGGYARMRSDCVLAGRGGTGNLSALYFGKGDQMHDLRTFQTHDAPDTTSNLLFKGVVDDRARSVYTGLIRVGHEARGTNANQTNRNIKLSEEAWAESVPNLEIHQNDVRCSHASAVGPIDADQRFYLESRGVPPEVAERLVVAGFFEEVIDELADSGLAASIRGQVANKLDTAAEVSS